MTTPPVSYTEYHHMVNGALLAQLDKQPGARWRRGQAYFNVLHTIKPDLANRLRGTRHDPFFDDAKVPDFLAYVAQHWDAPPRNPVQGSGYTPAELLGAVEDD